MSLRPLRRPATKRRDSRLSQSVSSSLISYLFPFFPNKTSPQLISSPFPTSAPNCACFPLPLPSPTISSSLSTPSTSSALNARPVVSRFRRSTREERTETWAERWRCVSEAVWRE